MSVDYSASALRAKWDVDRARIATRGSVRPDDELPPIGKREFEDALRANPDDREIYLVYADWLSEQGDDWGQLIVLQHAIESLPRFGANDRRDQLSRDETMLRFRLSGRLWGSLGERVYNTQTQTYYCDLIDATWQCGFVRAARIRNHDDDVFPELARGLNELAIGIVLREVSLDGRDWEPRTIEAFVERTWPLLERLSIDGEVELPRIQPILENAPRLAQLSIWHSHIDLSGLDLTQKRARVWEIARSR